jgi:hypothetical protein
VHPLRVFHSATIRRSGSHGSLRQPLVCLPRGIAGAFPQSEWFHGDRKLFGGSDVAGSGSHHRIDTDGRDLTLGNVPNHRCTGDLGVVRSEIKINGLVPVIRKVLRQGS